MGIASGANLSLRVLFWGVVEAIMSGPEVKLGFTSAFNYCFVKVRQLVVGFG